MSHDKIDEDDETVVTFNQTTNTKRFNSKILPRALQALVAKKDLNDATYAIIDSGATGHFLVIDAPALNKEVALNPIKIMLPNGKMLISTHTCNLDIPEMPAHVTEAHIVPGLAQSLLAVRKFSDAGCDITFRGKVCRIRKDGKTILAGTQESSTGLWKAKIGTYNKPQKRILSTEQENTLWRRAYTHYHTSNRE